MLCVLWIINYLPFSTFASTSSSEEEAHVRSQKVPNLFQSEALLLEAIELTEPGLDFIH